MSQAEPKKQLRQHILAQLRSLPTNTREKYSATLRGLLSPFLEGAPKRIALYYPLPHEVNLLPLLETYPLHRFAFPRCMPGRRLKFSYISEPERELVPAAMGIPAPLETLPEVSPNAFDLVVVPGVAFTRQGERLGYGGGYYDRYLPRCTSARMVATAFPEQIVPHVPTEEYDLRIPVILTP